MISSTAGTWQHGAWNCPMCQCVIAESNVPYVWVCEFHTSTEKEPSDLLLVVDLMKTVSFAVSVTACTHLSPPLTESIIGVGINEAATLSVELPVKPGWRTGLRWTVESDTSARSSDREAEDTSDIKWSCNILRFYKTRLVHSGTTRKRVISY